MLSADQQQAYMQAQQRQAIGQAMLAQGMQPIDTSNRVVAGRAYRVSPLEGVSKLLQTYLGNKLSMDSMGQQAQLTSAAYGKAFGTDQQADPSAAQDSPPVATPSPDAGFGIGAGNYVDGVSAASQPTSAQLGTAILAGAQAPVAAPRRVTIPGPLTLPGMYAEGSKAAFGVLGQDGYSRAWTQFNAPTEASRMADQGGFDRQFANQAKFKHDTYMAPVQIGANQTVLDPSTGALSTTPAAAPAGYQNILGADGRYYATKVAGGPEAVQESKGRESAGAAQYSLNKVWDSNYVDPETGQRGRYVMQTTANVADAANGNLPAPMRSNNPGALMPNGKLTQYPDLQTGLTALDNNLASYGKKGIDTIEGVISRWAPPSENNTKAYIADVSQRLGIPAGQKIDLGNPAVRHALTTAIMLHENGPQGVFGGGKLATSGPMAAEPSLGATANANTAQQGGAEAMNASYGVLQKARAGGAAAVEDINHMIQLGNQKWPTSAGAFGTHVMPFLSSNAAEYEKSRDNLVGQLSGQLGMNTDSARDLVYGSVPSYGAPHDAIINGLTVLRNQVQTRQLKASVLTPYFNAGDSKTYHQLESKFDETVKPSMTPGLTSLLSMQPGPARAQALQQAAKDPSMRSALELLSSSGVLK